MGAVYYYRHGGVKIPVEFIYEDSIWAKGVLDNHTKPDQRKDFYILVAAQDDYFNWFSDYQPILFRSFDFNILTKMQYYNDNIDSTNLKTLFAHAKIKYIVKNQVNFSPYLSFIGDFFDKIGKSNEFKLIVSKDDKYFVWQAY